MSETRTLSCIIQNQFELNLSFMPFIVDGGLFIPTTEAYTLGEKVLLDLQLPGQSTRTVPGKVIWITPKNTLYQIYQGVGIQFTGPEAKIIHELVMANIDTSMDVGGYTYGLSKEQNMHTDDSKKR